MEINFLHESLHLKDRLDIAFTAC